MINTSTDYKNNKESLIKDIAEREKIISDYKKYGILDRDKAINKIQELRIKDKEVEEITIAKLATFSILLVCQQTSKSLLNLICRKKF